MLNVDCFNFANLKAHRNAIPSFTNLPSSVKTKIVDESLVLYISIRNSSFLGIFERTFCYFNIGRNEFSSGFKQS